MPTGIDIFCCLQQSFFVCQACFHIKSLREDDVRVRGGEEKRRNKPRLPHACQYSNRSQFSRDHQGPSVGASLWQRLDPQNQDFKSGKASHWVSGGPPPTVIYISLGNSCRLPTRRLNTRLFHTVHMLLVYATLIVFHTLGITSF